MSGALDRVRRGNLCAGCGACAALTPAVGMEMREGFLRPVERAGVSAAEDRAIAAVCPGLGLRLRHDAPEQHALWGPVRAVATGHARDGALRHEASSGGALSAVLVHLLESGAADFVLQTAADPANPVGNRTVLSRTRDEVLAAAGSRYAPSAPLDGIGAVLETAEKAGERGAFVGKPCDVAALRALADRDPRVGRVFPHVLSFFCAGVPARAGAEQVVRKLGFAIGEVARFRYRGRGWPGLATAEGRDGRTASMTYHASWGGILSHHVQFRCKICADGVGSFADIACADAWETDEAGYPLFDEAPGASLIVARTAHGADLMAAAEAAGALATTAIETDAITPMQPGQARRTRVVTARLAGMALAGRPRPRYRGFALGRAARLARPAERLRQMHGTFRRALARRN